MRGKRILAAVGAAGLVLVLTGTAHAAQLTLSQGRGYGGNETYRVYACDTKADGWGVRTYYELQNGEAGLVGDGNGSTSPCGSRNMPSPVVWIAVCAGPNGADSDCRYLTV
jgi:hypothetical protein